MPSFRLHSKYNPHKEAEQFVHTIEGYPSIIVITEPGESYLAGALRTAFPAAKLIAVRYTDSLFADSDLQWDVVWRPAKGNLPFFLLAHIPDEQLRCTRFLSWKAADKAFHDEAVTVWKSIRYTIDLLTSVMNTRSFFGRRWLKNMVDNACRLVNPTAIRFGTQDFILAGAGPSLQLLTAVQAASYSVIAVTSAYAALAARNIPIQLCVTTDAGYWARRLFDGISHSMPLAFPLEAAVPAAMLQHSPCVLLSYGSPLEVALCTALGFSPLAARENGTVTGTACDLLLRHTHRNIILTGVDLALSPGFSHAQPHQSTIRTLCSSDRFHPVAAALAVQQFQARSLETYRQWFLQLPPDSTRRLFRVRGGGAAMPNIASLDSFSIPQLPSSAGAGMPSASCSSRGSAAKPIRLSIQPYAIAGVQERMYTVHRLLSALHTGTIAVIMEHPQQLAAKPMTIEKQLCALCGYTAYCTMLKDITNAEAQKKLVEQVTGVFEVLMKRTAP